MMPGVHGLPSFSTLRDAVEVQRRELQSRLSERYVERRLGAGYGGGDLIKVIIGPRKIF